MTCRAQRVARVHAALRTAPPSAATRLDALLEARGVLSAEGATMSPALELIDREVDMLNRCQYLCRRRYRPPPRIYQGRAMTRPVKGSAEYEMTI